METLGPAIWHPLGRVKCCTDSRSRLGGCSAELLLDRMREFRREVPRGPSQAPHRRTDALPVGRDGPGTLLTVKRWREWDELNKSNCSCAARRPEKPKTLKRPLRDAGASKRFRSLPAMTTCRHFPVHQLETREQHLCHMREETTPKRVQLLLSVSGLYTGRGACAMFPRVCELMQKLPAQAYATPSANALCLFADATIEFRQTR